MASPPVSPPLRDASASPLLLDTPSAARLLALSPATLTTWRTRSAFGPPFVRIGRRSVRYPVKGLLEWLARSRPMTSTSDVAA